MSSPMSNSNRAKTKLSVASLLNYSTNIDKQTKTHSPPVISTMLESNTSIAVVSRNSPITSWDTSMSTTTVTNVRCNTLPTVANTDLLYKSVSSSPHHVLSIPPLAPTKSKFVPPLAPTKSKSVIQTNYFQPSNIITYENNSNPLSRIKTLTNSVSFPVTTQNIVTPSYIHIKPAIASKRQVVLSKDLTSTLTNQHNHNIPHSNQTQITQHNIVSKTNEKYAISSVSPVYSQKQPVKLHSMNLSSLNAVKNAILNSQNASNKNAILNSQKDGGGIFAVPASNSPRSAGGSPNVSNGMVVVSKSLPAVLVPRGWNRTLDKDSIAYISPNRSKLRNKEDLLHYLQIDGTCKCGLECPFKFDEVFDFNVKVPSKFGVADSTSNTNKYQCKTHKKFEELFPPSVKLKTDRRGRKPGQKNKIESSDENSSPDRKRISLTGVSPLEVFQSGMNAINHLSASPLIKNNLQPNKVIVPNTVQSVASSFNSNLISIPNHEAANLSVFTSNVSVNTTSNITGNKLFTVVPASPQLLSTNAYLGASVPMNKIITVSHPKTSSSSEINASSLFTTVMSGIKKQRQKKTGLAKGRGKGNVVDDKKKKIIRKALPNAEIQKASDLQLHHIVNTHQSKTFLVDQKGSIQISNIPSLRSITSVPKASLRNNLVTNEQIIAAQNLLAAQTSRTTLDLQNIYETLQVAVQQQTSAVRTQSPMNTTSLAKNETLKSLLSRSDLPPNRTVSTTDHLNDAIMNQLSGKVNEMYHTSLPNAILSSTESSSIPSLNQMQMYSMAKLNPTTVNTSSSTITNHVIKKNETILNKPITQTSYRQSSVSPTVSTATTNPGNQMVFLHFVSQGDNASKINTPLVRTYSVGAQPSTLSSQQQSKYLVMDNTNTASQTLQTLALQQNQTIQQKLSPTENKAALQYQNIVTLQNLQSQNCASSRMNKTSSCFQYVQTVNPNNAVPVVHYLQQTSPYLYSTATDQMTTGSTGKNLVRIAPGPISSEANASTLLFKQQLEKSKEDELRKLQEELFRKPKKLTISTESSNTSSKSGTINKSSFQQQNTKSINNSSNIMSPSLKISSMINSKLNEQNKIDTQETFSANKVNINSFCTSTKGSSSSSLTNLINSLAAPSSTMAPAYIPLSSSLSSKNQPRGRSASVPSATKSITINKELRRDSLDEASLLCDEKPISSIKDEAPSVKKPQQEIINRVATIKRSSEYNLLNDNLVKRRNSNDEYNLLNDNLVRRNSNDLVGMMVWVSLPGYPSWPGKILSASQLKKSDLPPNQVYVSWYGSHHVQPVNLHALKPFDDTGLTTMHQNIDQHKYRENKKQLNDLEKAVAEALQEVESTKKLMNE